MRIRRSTQLGTHSTALAKGFWNGVYPQDMTELVPVVDVFLIGPIECGKFLLHSKVEFMARGCPLFIISLPVVLLAKAIEFDNR